MTSPMKKQRFFSFSSRYRRYSWYWYVFLICIPLLFWLVVKDIDLTATLKALSSIGVARILALLLLNLLIFFTMTVRWWLILVALGYKIPFLILIGFRLAGNVISYFTPGPQFGGEPAQVYLLHRIQLRQVPNPVPLDTATASVIIDRLMELVANFSLLSIGIFLCSNSGFSRRF